MFKNKSLEKLISIFVVISFAVVLSMVCITILNVKQRRKKLLPEFINGKPTLAFFWVDNPTCKAMSLIIEKIKNDFKGSVKTLNFNVVKDYKIAENYLILDVPIVILFDKEGNQVIRITKPKDYSKLEIKLKEII